MIRILKTALAIPFLMVGLVLVGWLAFEIVLGAIQLSLMLPTFAGF